MQETLNDWILHEMKFLEGRGALANLTKFYHMWMRIGLKQITHLFKWKTNIPFFGKIKLK